MKAALYLLSTILVLTTATAASEPQLPDRPREPTNPAATVVSIHWYAYAEAQAAIITHLREENALLRAALAEPARADTHTWGGAPDAPQGAALQLYAKSQGGKAYERVIYLQFDMRHLTVAPRKLAVHTHPETAAGVLTLWPVADDTWSEATLTWNNQPARGTAPLATIPVAAETDAELMAESEALAAYLAAEFAGDKIASIALTANAVGDGIIRLYSREGAEVDATAAADPATATP